MQVLLEAAPADVSTTGGRTSPFDDVIAKIKSDPSLHRAKQLIAKFDRETEPNQASRWRQSLRGKLGDRPDVAGWTLETGRVTETAMDGEGTRVVDLLIVSYDPDAITPEGRRRWELRKKSDRAKRAEYAVKKADESGNGRPRRPQPVPA